MDKFLVKSRKYKKEYFLKITSLFPLMRVLLFLPFKYNDLNVIHSGDLSDSYLFLALFKSRIQLLLYN